MNLGKILNSDCFPLDGCSDSKFGSNYSKICMQPCMTLTQTGKVAKSWKNAWKYDYSETFGITYVPVTWILNETQRENINENY